MKVIVYGTGGVGGYFGGRPSELASQNGAVVRMGLELGIPTPTHAFIYHSLLPLEAKARGELTF